MARGPCVRTEAEALALLRDGWQIGKSQTMDGSTWLQKGGAGCGGESRTLACNVFLKLYRTKQITVTKQGFPTTTYDIAKEPTP